MKFIRLSVERLEVLVAENGTSLGTDVLRTAPSPTHALAGTHQIFMLF